MKQRQTSDEREADSAVASSVDVNNIGALVSE